MIHRAVVLDASLAPGEALRRLKPYRRDFYVVIRQGEGTFIYWYYFTARKVHAAALSALRKPLEGRPGTLGESLDLHEGEACPAFQEQNITAAEKAKGGVVLNGGKVTGVLLPDVNIGKSSPQVPSFSRQARGGRELGEALSKTANPYQEKNLKFGKSDGESYIEKSDMVMDEGPRATKSLSSGKGLESVYPRITGRDPIENIVSDPPRSAFALLQCPDVVVAEEEFELVLGLAAEQISGIIGDRFTRPESSHGSYQLTVQVVASGFRLRQGESWRAALPVSTNNPYPSICLHLESSKQEEAILPRSIQAIYSVDGQTIGMGVRSVAVVREARLRTEAKIGDQDPPTTISVQAGPSAPDLTIRISTDSKKPGELSWTFDTPFGEVIIPDEPVCTSIGGQPQTFTRDMMRKANLKEGTPALSKYLLGCGKQIAKSMPSECFLVLRSVQEHIKRIPSVLLLSQEPYVPWELAALESPLFDDQAPPFLSTQVNIGRWVLGSQQRPKQPPSSKLVINGMGVVSGVYNRPGWKPLAEAEDEAKQIKTNYGAVSINAASMDVSKCLDGNPAVDLLHFAMHGNYDPNGTQDGLVLVDGCFLDPMEVQGGDLPKAPFVFLNACQVGQGNEVLGDYAGMAESFLYAGASAVVAPLWSVKDDIARQIALEFYNKAFDRTSPPEVGELFRQLRRQFDPNVGKGTYLAYQFFGHPTLKLWRQ